MPRIHWLGAGLSSGPGIHRLARCGYPLSLWNRTLSKAEEILYGTGSAAEAKTLDWQVLANSLNPGDILVSMLPGTMHPQVARLCLEQKCHLVTTSYLSPEIRALSEQVAAGGLCFVNEVGLDPGIDHLMAHSLMADYQKSNLFDPLNSHYFRSYCGGFPKTINDFRYKFSWSPLAVLRALKSPAQWISKGETMNSQKVWEFINRYHAELSGGAEWFQSYPNRDSIPYLAEYGFSKDWNVQEFIRGTLRLEGWSDAWQPIFEQIERLKGDSEEQVLNDLSAQLWENHQYGQEESDRVVLCVELEIQKENQPIWHQLYTLDETRNEQGTAMARLVSWTCSIAVESILNDAIKPGVGTAPNRPEQVKNWMNQLRGFGVQIHRTDLVKPAGNRLH
ncbi:MAG TPA: saccharopine dehydrogenase [Verrucomicrobia bacterium]|nr:saccharopine dehydrogenase [Verrucomicrobiota bacterium]